MSSNKSATAPALTLKPSRLLRVYLIMITASALAVLWYLNMIDWPVKLPLTVFICYSTWRAWQQHERFVYAKHRGENRWLLVDKNGEELRAEFVQEFYVITWLVVMNFKLSTGERVSLVLLQDRLESDLFRAIRVYLRQLPRAEK
ncbi:MAG: hypothetical protein OEZ39_12155 [Gammaproteobacteria bacterium]|nr:hypothetical protein [Gammaproteobacteria bacterium]MDH5652597.1 hypothetical protein [Gammaproteobacteria bacterium]